ncbi:MAG: TRAP transporter substrate-binding protein DctP [Treponema sp.]|jgi:TRAP-type C4-dicarboxylate transport system substrate-binding protein|nr:TRAP transporter substrate-binding protein DctP [Treponema sp.]
MKKGIAFLTLVVFTLFFITNQVFSQRGGRAQEVIEVRLASPLPRNSDWGRLLDRISGEWSRVTDNQVRLRVIHDGLEGGEGKMLSSLNSDNIQAAVFTSAVLSEICPPVMTLSIPFIIKNNAELDAVLKDVLPVLDDQVNKANKFVIISWSKGGWVYVFSKDYVVTPDDLRRQKFGTSPDLRDLNTVFRTMGFNLVEVDYIDTGTKLANNVINSFYLIPEALAPLGLHRSLSNMMDMPIAPVMGAIVMNRVTWNKLSADRQRELLKVTQRLVSDFEITMAKTSANAVTIMSRDGLKLNKPNSSQQDLWRTEVEKAIPMLFGNLIDRNLYNQMNQILERYRNRRN